MSYLGPWRLYIEGCWRLQTKSVGNYLRCDTSSKNMATATAKVIQAIRPHMPLIKFPRRGSPDISMSSSEVSSQPITHNTLTFAAPAPPTKPTVTSSKPVGYTPRGSGKDYKDLPLKYHRKPFEEQEIEYLLRGGPE